MTGQWKGARNIEIEKLFSQGETMASLARQFSLSQARVQQIIVNTRRMRKKIAQRLDAPLRHAT